MTGNDETFSQLAESALSSILQVGTKSQCIDVVFDVYREIFIKTQKEQIEVLIWVFSSGILHLGTASSGGENYSAALPTKQV